MAKILSEVVGVEIKFIDVNKEQQDKMFSMIPSIWTRNYMESAKISMDLTINGKFKPKLK